LKYTYTFPIVLLTGYRKTTNYEEHTSVVEPEASADIKANLSNSKHWNYE